MSSKKTTNDNASKSSEEADDDASESALLVKDSRRKSGQSLTSLSKSKRKSSDAKVHFSDDSNKNPTTNPVQDKSIKSGVVDNIIAQASDKLNESEALLNKSEENIISSMEKSVHDRNTSSKSVGGADNSDSTSLTTLSLSNSKSPPADELPDIRDQEVTNELSNSVNNNNQKSPGKPRSKQFLPEMDNTNSNESKANSQQSSATVNPPTTTTINGSNGVSNGSDKKGGKILIKSGLTPVDNSASVPKQSTSGVNNSNGKDIKPMKEDPIMDRKFQEKELTFSNGTDMNRKPSIATVNTNNGKNGQAKVRDTSRNRLMSKGTIEPMRDSKSDGNGAKKKQLNGKDSETNGKPSNGSNPKVSNDVKMDSKKVNQEVLIDIEGKKDSSPPSNLMNGDSLQQSNPIAEKPISLSQDPFLPLQGLSPAEKLIMLCSREEWLHVDTLLHQTEPEGFDKNVVAQKTLWTPVMFAAKDNRINIVEKLLDYGYDINSRAMDGITALHLACAHAREDTVRLLLSRKADPLIAGGPKDQLPIHIVACKPVGQALAPMQLLLRSSAKSMRMIPDKDGNIPLILAAENGNHSVCRELLASQAKEQLAYRKPGLQDSVVHIAARRKDIDLLQLFIENGGDANAQNINGQTPLHFAAAEGDENMVKYLHGIGANPNVADKEEQTPLHIATENGHIKVVEVLTDKFRANLNLRTKDGSTLMHIASRSGHPMTALSFLKRGVPLHMPNKDGAKAIHVAASTGQVDIIRHVLKSGENVDIRTNNGLTPLHLAVEAGQSEVVEVLLGYGASAHCKTSENNETPLHLAAKTENGLDAARLLIKSGANVNAIEKKGESPLHFAGRHGFVDTFKQLLDAGADPMLQNEDGENVLHVTVKECHFPIAQHLMDSIIKKQSKQIAEQLINQQNKKGESSVHYTATIEDNPNRPRSHDKALINLLLRTGGDVNLGNFETWETPIHYCCKSGNTNVLQEIINQLPPIEAQIACNKPSKSRWTPLLYACNSGHPEIIKILLSQNARVDVFDDRGRAGLHLAAELGRLDVVDILLANNAFVNVRNKTGMTPLHLAAKMGYNDMVKHLVAKYGAHLDAMTLTKQTPLHLAAEYGQLDVCNTLLSMKADVNAMDNQSQTPLHLAAQSDHPEVLKLFLQHRPELVSAPNKQGFTCAHIAATKGSVAVLKELMKFNVEVVKSARIKKTGSTALHLAAEGGHSKVVRLLLQSGAKAADENLEGMTPLHLAAKQGHLRVLNALKGSVDLKVCSRKTGFTALHVAAANGQIDFVSEMLTQTPAGILSERPLADPSADYGITPLHLAAQHGHESVVRLLMNSTGVAVDAATKLHGCIPMHMAAQGGHMLVAGLLVSRSAESLHIRDKQGRTCLHLAAASGHRDMVGLLLGQGAEINVQDRKGWSPLHCAARYGFIDVVQLLVDSGADPTATTKDGRVPLCCAASAGHYEVLSYLLNKEHDALVLMEDKTFLLDLMNASKNHNNKPIREFVLVSEACIDTAVKLARQYENIAIREKERARDLEAASKYCDQIAIDLLSIAATTNNAGALLRATDNRNTEFLDVLIELDRKDVVAQHAVQKYLTDVWMGNLQWAGYKFVLLFFASLICPLVWIIISTPIGHRLHRIPIIKFMSYLCSHIFFILVLTYTIVFPSVKLFEYEDSFPLWNEWLLLIWLIGILVSDMTNPSDKSGLGGIRVCILVIGFAAVMVHVVVTMLDSWIFDRDELIFDQPWQIYRLDTLYIRNQLLAVSMLLSFIEFLNFLTFHPLFGPWGVIIQELIQDLLRFLAILSIFLSGFTLHICAIYQPVYRAPDGWNMTNLPIGQDFLKPGRSFEMLFFALFGLVEPDTMPPMHLSPDFSKIIMKLVFGIYMMVTVIVLINLLIAMMSNTYQRIEAQSDIEWKFGRAKLIRNMNRTLSTPSPINLILGLPIIFFHKIKDRFHKDRVKDMQLAKKAFGHLAQQRPSVIAAKTLLQRKASRLSATTQVTNPFGISLLEAAIHDSKPIATVVNWPMIVQKYYESIGEASPTAITGMDINTEDQSEENVNP